MTAPVISDEARARACALAEEVTSELRVLDDGSAQSWRVEEQSADMLLLVGPRCTLAVTPYRLDGRWSITTAIPPDLADLAKPDVGSLMRMTIAASRGARVIAHEIVRRILTEACTWTYRWRERQVAAKRQAADAVMMARITDALGIAPVQARRTSIGYQAMVTFPVEEQSEGPSQQKTCQVWYNRCWDGGFEVTVRPIPVNIAIELAGWLREHLPPEVTT